MKKFGFCKIEGSPGEEYLKQRFQMNFYNFAWDQKRYGVVIFNMDVEENVIGLQIRLLKKTSIIKYFSMTLKQIYIELNLPVPEDIDDLNKFSLLFGILKVNLNESITFM
jgi:hypothetical protein